MNPKAAQTITELKQVLALLQSNKKPTELDKQDLATLKIAIRHFGSSYNFKDYLDFVQSLPQSAVLAKIAEIEKVESAKEPSESKQETAIPPELESLVAEYRLNQERLSQKEIASNNARSVAEQVKIALAHARAKQLALVAKERRISQNKEAFLRLDTALTRYGAQKSGSISQALEKSDFVVRQIASSYPQFDKLSPEVQSLLINQAIELNLVGIIDINVAIQTAAILISSSALGTNAQETLAQLSRGYVSAVYQDILQSDLQTQQLEEQIALNEKKLYELRQQGKNKEAEELQKETFSLISRLDEQSTELDKKLAQQESSFQAFADKQKQSLVGNPDLIDQIDLANKNVSSIHDQLTRSGIKPHLYQETDDFDQLLEAIRHDLPGRLLPNSGYQAEYVAAFFAASGNSLSPEVIRAYSRDLTPQLLAEARVYAEKNPDSRLGILLKNRRDLFNSAASQISTLANSPLGKDLLQNTKGFGKIVSPVTKFFGKFTDRLPTGIGNIARFVQNPLGALRSYLGRKIGEYVLKEIIRKTTNEALKKGAQLILKEGLKQAVTKLATQAGVKLAAYLGLSSTGAGIPIAAILFALDVVTSLAKLGKKIVQKAATAIYGEEIKKRDLLAIPLGFISGLATMVTAGFVLLYRSSVKAGSSAAVTIGLGSLAVFFFYIIAIATAPLISTLVQLEGSARTEAFMTGCANWPTAGVYYVTQGPHGIFSHAKNKLEAIDIGAPENTGFLAAAPGRVTFSAPLGSYGNAVIIAAETNVGTISMLYAHMNSVQVSVGQTVNVGDTIGSVGGTGGWAPHIHFEYRRPSSYNSCPAGDIPVPLGCNGPSDCTYNGQAIQTNKTLP